MATDELPATAVQEALALLCCAAFACSWVAIGLAEAEGAVAAVHTATFAVLRSLAGSAAEVQEGNRLPFLLAI